MANGLCDELDICDLLRKPPRKALCNPSMESIVVFVAAVLEEMMRHSSGMAPQPGINASCQHHHGQPGLGPPGQHSTQNEQKPFQTWAFLSFDHSLHPGFLPLSSSASSVHRSASLTSRTCPCPGNLCPICRFRSGLPDFPNPGPRSFLLGHCFVTASRPFPQSPRTSFPRLPQYRSASGTSAIIHLLEFSLKKKRSRKRNVMRKR